ncbi:MAG TPA: beta-L-arabinofuranosidase domain-containing protein [Caulobacteraceae bacterium]|jgi:hypothetical protein
MATAAAAGVVSAAPVRAQTPSRLQPFPLSAVTLGDGPLLDATRVNARRLAATDPDRLLHMFRVTAGLPSSAQPLGGWEAPVNELRGHFTGHFLSACAQMSAQGDGLARAKGSAIVRALADCQKANGAGYVSAFPPEFFDRLKRREKVWAPFYTLHKITAGLIDMHTLADDPDALAVARGLGDWTDRWSAELDDAQMQAVLDTEFGGMGEALWNLQALTGDERYGRAAVRFEKRKFLDPLAAQRDALTGLHANTHIPQVIAAARKAEITGDGRSRRIAEFFWDDVVANRTFVTGGTSSGEDWKLPVGQLSKELDAYTHECCCTHNMLKLTRHVMAWRGDARAGDYYERAFLNGVLGTHHPADGMMMYYVPMQWGYWKMFSDHDNGFWCCDGTGVESFSKLGDSVFFHDAQDLYVNLYANASADWRERGVTVTQSTTYPQTGDIAITVAPRIPTSMAVNLRIPAWAGERVTAHVNGEPWVWEAGVWGGRAGRWLTIDRVWRSGDVIRMSLPMHVRTEAMADDPKLAAVMYGPLVLAGGLGTQGLPPEAPYALPTPPRQAPEFRAEPVAAPALARSRPDWIASDKADPLKFRVATASGELVFRPFNQILHERYGVYWRFDA